MKLYTGLGDSGKTSLASGARVVKTNARIEAIGAVDELNSFVGLAGATSKADAQLLAKIQADLFSIGAELASADEKTFQKIAAENVKELEDKLAEVGTALPQLKNFVLPAGTQYATALHVCRSVCRRAERAVVELEESEGKNEGGKENEKQKLNPQIKVYLNRLSSLFFGLALAENKLAGIKETTWP